MCCVYISQHEFTNVYGWIIITYLNYNYVKHGFIQADLNSLYKYSWCNI